MSLIVYDSKKKEISCGGLIYDHYSGEETTDEIATTLVRFGSGELSFQDAWLRLNKVKSLNLLGKE